MQLPFARAKKSLPPNAFCDMIRRAMLGEIRIRPGAAEDLAQVQEFTRDTFTWGDYLPKAWNDWVRSKRGELLVAERDTRVLGTIHVRYLEHREAWLEGVRVHHEFRKHGIASILIQAAHARAHAKKCRVIRLETSAQNFAAQRAFEKFDYRVLESYAVFKGTARAGEMQNVRLAKLRDLAACWELWQHSWLKRASKTVVPAVYGWRWWELTRQRLAHDIRNARVWVAPHGFMTLREMDNDFDIILLVGKKRAARALLDAGRVLAQQRGRAEIFWLAPHVARAKMWAADADYTMDEDGMLIYERKL